MTPDLVAGTTPRTESTASPARRAPSALHVLANTPSPGLLAEEVDPQTGGSSRP